HPPSSSCVQNGSGIGRLALRTLTLTRTLPASSIASLTLRALVAHVVAIRGARATGRAWVERVAVVPRQVALVVQVTNAWHADDGATVELGDEPVPALQAHVLFSQIGQAPDPRLIS